MKLFRKKFTQYSDEELFRIAGGNSNAAFEELYKRYSKKLYYFLFQLLHGDEEKARDFLHDVFLKVLERPHLFDTNRRFSTWLYTCATNLCKNEFRNQQVRGVVGNGFDMNRFGQEHDQVDDQVHRKWFKESLQRELDALSPEQKTTFILRFQQGFSIREIAEIMQCSEGTVKSRVFYTIKKLGKQLAAFHPKATEEFYHES